MESNRNVFENLMNIGGEKIRAMIATLDTVLDVKKKKQEYNELKKYFRDYKNGTIKLETDEDRKTYSEKPSEYFRLQKDIKENVDDKLQGLQNSSEAELTKEHKRLSVFLHNSDYIKWAKEKLAESETAKKKYEKVAEEKNKFDKQDGKELEELRSELNGYMDGTKEIENDEEYNKKFSRFRELDRKKRRIEKGIKAVQSEIESISDKDIEKAEKIIKITTDENNWDMLMETSLDSLLNEPQKPEEKKGEELEQKGPEENDKPEQKPAEKKTDEKETGEKPRMVEIQNGRIKPLEPEPRQKPEASPAPKVAPKQEPKADKPVFKDEEEHSENLDYYLEEVNWKENLKRFPSDIINLIKDVREASKAGKQARKENFIKEYMEENGKKPSRMKVFIATHKSLNKIAEFFKEVGKASQSLTPEEQEAGKVAMKKGFTFRSSREEEEKYDKEHKTGSFQDRRNTFVNRDDIATDVTPELREFEDISSNSRGESEPEAPANTEPDKDDAR